MRVTAFMQLACFARAFRSHFRHGKVTRNSLSGSGCHQATQAGAMIDNPNQVGTRSLRLPGGINNSRTTPLLRVPTRIVRKTNVRSSEQAILVAKNRKPMYINSQNQCWDVAQWALRKGINSRWAIVAVKVVL